MLGGGKVVVVGTVTSGTSIVVVVVGCLDVVVTMEVVVAWLVVGIEDLCVGMEVAYVVFVAWVLVAWGSSPAHAARNQAQQRVREHHKRGVLVSTELEVTGENRKLFTESGRFGRPCQQPFAGNLWTLPSQWRVGLAPSLGGS